MSIPQEPLASFRTTVVPDYSTIVIRDESADPIPHPPMPWVLGASGDGYRIALGSAQQLVDVIVDIRVWSDQPTAVEDGWSSPVLLQLHCETGALTVDGLYPRSRRGGLQLRRPGTYRVTVRWQGIREVADRIQDVYRMANQEAWPLERTRAELNLLAGIERFRVDLW